MIVTLLYNPSNSKLVYLRNLNVIKNKQKSYNWHYIWLLCIIFIAHSFCQSQSITLVWLFLTLTMILSKYFAVLGNINMLFSVFYSSGDPEKKHKKRQYSSNRIKQLISIWSLKVCKLVIPTEFQCLMYQLQIYMVLVEMSRAISNLLFRATKHS